MSLFCICMGLPGESVDMHDACTALYSAMEAAGNDGRRPNTHCDVLRHHLQCVPPGFYKGRIAKAIIAALDEEKGVMKLDDLEQHRSTVTRPIHTTYRGHTIYEVPPPTQARALPLRKCSKRASQTDSLTQSPSVIGDGAKALSHWAAPLPLCKPNVDPSPQLCCCREGLH